MDAPSRRNVPVITRSAGSSASKRLFAVAGAVSMLVSFVGAFGPVARAESPALRDDALIACINTKLGLAADAVATDDQLASVTTLSCSSKGIKDLTGIGRLTSLQKAFLQSNSISDVSPLAANKEIFSLNLSGNQITDISPLRELTKLSSVNVASNHIGDMTPVGHVAKLSITSNSQKVTGSPAETGVASAVPTVIDRTGTSVRPEESPAGVTIRGNEVTYPKAGEYTWKFWDESRYYNGSITVTVSDPKPAVVEIPDANLRKCVTRALNLAEDDPITPEQAASLSELRDCYGKKIESVEGLQHFTGLTKLVLSTNQITDLTPIKGLTGLRELMLPGNPLSSIEPLSGLTSLQILNLRDTGVVDVKPLSALASLEDLNISYAKPRGSQVGKARLTSLAGVESLTSLTRLVAHDQAIADLGPLAGLIKLQTLAASGNEISDLTPLASTGLTKIVLDRNKISDISPLAGLNLVEISMSQNSISDVSALAGKKLEKIYLSTNKIADLSPMSTNYVANGNFDARWQAAIAAPVPAEMAVSVPTVRTADGKAVTRLTPPDGITVVDGKVTYPQAGDYKWTFSDTKFGGSVTQQVTEPVSNAANIPDTNLRRCIAGAAGKDVDEMPTEADVAALKSLSCPDRSIKDLTGLEGATSLETLNLAGNPLDSLAVVTQLSALKSLDLSRTEMKDTTAIASLRGLDQLILDANHLRDLSGINQVATTIQAKNQTFGLDPITGDEPASVPAITDRNGQQVRATVVSEGASVSDSSVTYPVAGDYSWKAATEDGLFTATIVQSVTRDRIVPIDEAAARACLDAKNVWVVVERDTGLQKGGCATQFANGIEALNSAGFNLTETGGFVQKIDGYPVRDVDWTEGFWSYLHLTPGDDPSWEFSQLGAGEYQPQPGTVEGWRFGPATEPGWKPTQAPDPTPEPVKAPWGSGNADMWALTDDGAWFYDGSASSERHDFRFIRGAKTDVTMLKQYDWFGSTKMDLFERKANGDLTLSIDGTANPTVIGRKWGQITDITPMGGPATGEAPMLVARHRNGNLYGYRWAGNRLYGMGVVGQRWNQMSAIFSLGNSIGSSSADLLAINGSNSTLYAFAGRGSGKFAEATRIGSGWGGFVAFAPGRIDADTASDLAGLRSDGELFMYPSTGRGLAPAQLFGGGFDGIKVRVIG